MSRPPDSNQRVRCRAHCAACGAHFTSDAAFDAHRAGSHRDGTRHCLEPDDVDALRLVNDAGRCQLYPPFPEGIELWEHGQRVDAARERSERRVLTPA